jgi:hypothetical protein
MATIYAPKISAEDFPAFQNMTGLDLPATSEEWLQRQEDYKDGIRQNGDAVVEVDVNPSEFVRFLQATKASADQKQLQAFASAKVSAVTNP